MFAQIWRTRPWVVASLWRRVEARTAVIGLAIFRFCRSWADGSSGGFCFLNWWPDLHSFEGLSRWSSRICGGAWRCVVAPLLMIFSGFCASKSLEDFCGLIFLWNLVRNFRNPGWESAGFVELVAILVYIVVLMLTALTGGWLRLDLSVKREMVSHHFQTSVQPPFSNFGADFLDLECIWICKSWLSLFFLPLSQKFSI